MCGGCYCLVASVVRQIQGSYRRDFAFLLCGPCLSLFWADGVQKALKDGVHPGEGVEG